MSASKSMPANQVRLVGRLGVQVHERQLPSGDVLTSFSVVVDRAPNEVRGRTTIDTIPCVTARASVARSATAWPPGQRVEVEGQLRRRFWRTAAGLGSALEVDVRRLHRSV